MDKLERLFYSNSFLGIKHGNNIMLRKTKQKIFIMLARFNFRYEVEFARFKT